MANEQNLIPNSERSPEELREMARKGGIASGEARRKKKTFKEQIELLLSLPLKDEKARKQLEAMGIDPDNVDNQMAMVIAQWRTALKGGMAGVNAFNTLRDTVGEVIVNKQEITGSVPVVIDDDIKE